MSALDKFSGQLGAIAAAVMISLISILGTVSTGPAFAATILV
ncbi:hypothetical protein [Altererythrobacter aquiaggeris]